MLNQFVNYKNCIFRFDFDDSAFSPPSHDDNFFYIRYSKDPVTENASGFTNISTVISANQETNQVPSVKSSAPNFKDIKKIDFSKHPKACQAFIPSESNEGKKKIYFNLKFTLFIKTSFINYYYYYYFRTNV